MDTLKSRELFCGVLEALQHDSILSNRDFMTLSRRVTCEGDNFLMIQLPNFAKSLEQSLELGFYTPPFYFKVDKKTGFTCLFKEKLSLIFDNNKVIRDDADGLAIADIRQVCYLFNKVHSEFSDEQLVTAEEQFITTDSEVGQFDLDTRELTVLTYAQEFLSKLLNELCLKDIIPKHGPGASALGLNQLDRRVRKNQVIYRRLNERYPFYTSNYANSGDLASDVATYWAAKERGLQSRAYSRLCCVPKDSRGPRMICIEPHEYMWIQQGQMNKIYNYIESHPMTRYRVNFTDQSINQKLAYDNSKSRKLATLDLKDASDRVSLKLVQLLFPDHLLPYLEATRTGIAFLPKHNYMLFLKKYASMGNALTFPIEALVFYALIKGYMRLMQDSTSCYVYGDDLIVPSIHAQNIIEILENFGLRVNRSKSFIHGFFRESCGKDYYNGIDVTPVRIRRLDKDAKTSISILDTADQFFQKGMWATAKLLDSLQSQIAGGKRAFVSSPVLREPGIRVQRFTKTTSLYSDRALKRRYNSQLCINQYLVPVFKVQDEKDILPESEAYLMKHLHGWKVGDEVPDIKAFSILSNRKIKWTAKWINEDHYIASCS